MKCKIPIPFSKSTLYKQKPDNFPTHPALFGYEQNFNRIKPAEFFSPRPVWILFFPENQEWAELSGFASLKENQKKATADSTAITSKKSMDFSTSGITAVANVCVCVCVCVLKRGYGWFIVFLSMNIVCLRSKKFASYHVPYYKEK
jgi:hypothetical protein